MKEGDSNSVTDCSEKTEGRQTLREKWQEKKREKDREEERTLCLPPSKNKTPRSPEPPW